MLTFLYIYLALGIMFTVTVLLSIIVTVPSNFQYKDNMLLVVTQLILLWPFYLARAIKEVVFDK